MHGKKSMLFKSYLYNTEFIFQIEKDPSEFNEEDLKTVRDYEEKVAFLNSERERYRNILDTDFTKTSIALRDSIRKFNNKVAKTAEFKLLCDGCMNQENLFVNSHREINSCKISHIKLDEHLR